MALYNNYQIFSTFIAVQTTIKMGVGTKALYQRALRLKVGQATYKRLSNNRPHIVAKRGLTPKDCCQRIPLCHAHISALHQQPLHHTFEKIRCVSKYANFRIFPKHYLSQFTSEYCLIFELAWPRLRKFYITIAVIKLNI